MLLCLDSASCDAQQSDGDTDGPPVGNDMSGGRYVLAAIICLGGGVESVRECSLRCVGAASGSGLANAVESDLDPVADEMGPCEYDRTLSRPTAVSAIAAFAYQVTE